MSIQLSRWTAALGTIALLVSCTSDPVATLPANSDIDITVAETTTTSVHGRTSATASDELATTDESSSPASAESSNTATGRVVELWSASERDSSLEPIEGLPALRDSFFGPLALTIDGQLVTIDITYDNSDSMVGVARLVADDELPGPVEKVVPGGIITTEGEYYFAQCETTCSFQRVDDLTDVIDAFGCVAVDSRGTVWEITSCGGGSGFSDPVAVQGISGAVQLGRYVVPDFYSVMTSDGSAYVWGDITPMVPACTQTGRPLKLDGTPPLMQVQGPFGTDITGQMWTWIGVGHCNEPGVLTDPIAVAGPHDGTVSPYGIIFGDDGSVWTVGDEFDTYEARIDTPPVWTKVGDTNLPNGYHVVDTIKNGPIVVAQR